VKSLQNKTRTERLRGAGGFCRGDPQERSAAGDEPRNRAGGAALDGTDTRRRRAQRIPGGRPSPEQLRSATAQADSPRCGPRTADPRQPQRERPPRSGWRARPAVTASKRFSRRPTQVPVTASSPEPPTRLSPPWQALDPGGTGHGQLFLPLYFESRPPSEAVHATADKLIVAIKKT